MHFEIAFLSDNQNILKRHTCTCVLQPANVGATCLYPTFVKIFIDISVLILRELRRIIYKNVTVI